MKTLVAVFLFCLFQNALALDDSVFSEKYPGIKDYQSASLSGLNTYFFALLSKSIVFKDTFGNYQIQVQNEAGETILSLNARIERKLINNDLYEYVQYVLPNANTFDYSLKKTGIDQNPTSDNDLLTLNFKKLSSNYELSIYPLKTSFQKTGIKDYLIFGFMEVNISIQTLYEEDEATRNYIYFFKEMPNPQSGLTVKVIEESESTQTFNYVHSSNGAEISPKYFFKGLQEGAQVFKEFSGFTLQFVKMLGFPGIKGIN